MEDLIQRLRKWKKPTTNKKGRFDLDLVSPTNSEVSEVQQQQPAVTTTTTKQKAKFHLKKPRWTSTNDGGLDNSSSSKNKGRHSLGSSAASTASSDHVVVAKGGRPGSPFADEDDLFADRDDGVYMQSSSSSGSPAASERQGGTTTGISSSSRPSQPQRPASCTFGNNSFANGPFLQSQDFLPNHRPASVCSMVSTALASVVDQGQSQHCPICRCAYDSGKQRQLVDTNCGHARCFKCMFAIENCPLCYNNNSNTSAAASVRSTSVAGGLRNSNFPPKHQSSRESGFQSFNGSLSSIYSGLQLPSMAGGVDQNDMSNMIEMDRESSTGSLLSLMSAQSALNMMAPNGNCAPPSVISRHSNASLYESGGSGSSSFTRLDQKRHSLTSLGRYQNNPNSSSLASINSRNSFVRRSAFIPRNNRRTMSSIIEHQPLDNANWPLKPLFFEVPSPSSTSFVGRKWLFREVLEHLSSDLPTSGGMIIQGTQATGKSSIILRLVQGSSFGHQAPCMSNCIDILARDVVAFHFCQLDDEPTCTIPEFVHNLSAQMSRSPQLLSFRSLLQQSPELMALLSYHSCLENPSKALIKGILEPLALLRSQGKISGQRCLILIDSLCDAEYHRTDSGETLASFLALHLSMFPRWLRIICTVRSNMIDIMKPFPFHRLSLDKLSEDERLYKDVQDLVFQRIRESVLIQKNITPNATIKPEEVKACQTNFAHYVIQASRGNFLYVDLVLNFFKEGKLQVKSASFGMIPLTLSEVYLLAFNLKFQTQEAFLKIKDILCILAASLKPLTHQELFDCINALNVENQTKENFDDKLTTLHWLVKTRSNGTMTFFHPSVRDWLFGRRSTADSGLFACDSRLGHAAIALKLSRTGPLISPEQTLELGHHLLKANLFNRNAKDLQASWIAMASHDPTLALSHVKNLASPNVKVSRLLLLAGASPDGGLLEVKGAAGGNNQIGGLLLHKFAITGNLEMIQLLAEFGANLNAADPHGATALMKATQNGHFEIVDFLIKSNAEVNTTDSKGSTALVYAAKYGHNEVLQLFLSSPWPSAGCSLDTTAREALVVAAKEGHLDIMETLINSQTVEVNKPCGLSGELALCTAAHQGQLGSCQILLKGGADANVVNEKNLGQSPLFLAVQEGHYAIVDLLLNNGATIDVDGNPDHHHQSPVALAAAEGHVGVLELLLTRKADKEATDQDHLTPAAHAVIRGQTRTLDLLIKAEANIHTKDKNQRTLLHHAAVVKNNVKLVEMLMESGLDIEAMDKDGIRAIDMAIGHGNEVMVASLLRKGAKLGPTTWAMAKGKPRIALLLLNKLLEDGNTLFRKGRLTDAAYRYEYALRRLPRLRPDTTTASTTTTASEDIFGQMKTHLLLNLSRTKRKLGEYKEAETYAGQVLALRPQCHEAWWARAKARADQDQLPEALSDLREALKLAPQNLQLHAFSLQVKNQLERKQAKMFQKATTEMSSKMISKEDEDEIKSLEVTTLVIEN